MTEVVVTDCSRLLRWVEAYVDDELDAAHVLMVEEHLAACEACSEQLALTRALRASLRSTEPERPSHALRERLRAVMAVEGRLVREEAEPSHAADDRAADARAADDRAAADREPADRDAADRDAGDRAAGDHAAVTRDAQPAHGPRLVSLRYVMPLVIAASIALFVGAQRLRELDGSAQAERDEGRADASGSMMASAFDRYIDDLVLAHAQPQTPEVTDFEGLSGLDPKVGVRLPRPELNQLGMRYVGARLHHDAALMQFRGDRNRVTLYVFDPSRVPLHANRLRPRTVGSTRLYLGRVRGYAVAASERDGVGYALASDLGDEESARVLIQAASR